MVSQGTRANGKAFCVHPSSIPHDDDDDDDDVLVAVDSTLAQHL